MHESSAENPRKFVSKLTTSDLQTALFAGWDDFRAAPLFGLFFASIFVVGGLALAYASIVLGQYSWVIPAIAGFPLIAPFTAVGLYEVSRRHELGLPLRWTQILGAVRGRGDEQILSMGVILFVAFGFWIIIAHLVFAIFTAEAGAGSEQWDFLLTPLGAAMLAVGSAIGAVILLAFYAITLISLPMLVDREIDFPTAIFASITAFRTNTGVLLVWAVVIVALFGITILTLFTGLLLVLPVLGHATWHLYRRTVT